MILKAGATSQSVYVEVLDSTSTTGGRKTGLAFNTASLTGYYVRQGGSAVAITLATLAAANSAFSSGGFKEVDATNMPGVYRLDIPDAAIAAGVASVVVTLKGATGMVQISKEITLTAVDLQDTVRAGMTALPNAAAEAAGGLYTRGSGAGQITQDANGRIDVNLKAILGTLLTETAGQIAGAFKKVFDVAAPVFTALSVNQTGDNFARLGAPAGASLSADVAAVKADTAAVKLQTDKMAFTVANQIDSNVIDWKSAAAPAMTGDAFARLGAPAGASVSADVAAVKADTAAVKLKTDLIPAGGPAAATDYTAARAAKLDNLDATVSSRLATAGYTAPDNATIAAIAGFVDTEVAAIKAKTDNLPALPAAVGDIPTTNQNADALLDRAAGVETGLTVRQWARLTAAALLGKVSGTAVNAPVFRDTGDTKNRITATTDATGNRTAVTLDAT